MAERSRAQRLAIVVVGWLGAAVLATGVALAAVSSIGAGIFGNSAGPIDRQQITDALTTVAPSPQTPAPEPTTDETATPEATRTPESEPTESNGPDAEPTVITSPGGTVVARCAGNDRVEVLSWSPKQGFGVDNAEHGPAREIDVDFESEEQEVEIRLRCVDGEPDAAIESDD